MTVKRWRRKPINPLIGMYVHVMKDGRIDKQGRVTGTDGRWAYVQLFSFLDGSDTHTLSIYARTLRSAACRLYASAELMRFAYDLEEIKWRSHDEQKAAEELDRQSAKGFKKWP